MLRNNKDSDNHDLLCQGHVTSMTGLHWPDGNDEHSVSGFGNLQSVTGTDPAAGVEISDAVPTNAKWKLRAIKFTLVTDATVITRTVSITLDDGTTVFLTLTSRTGQTATQTIGYNANTFGVIPADTATQFFFVLPFDCWLFQTWNIKTVTVNLQAGDNFGAPVYIVEEFLED